MPNKELIDIAIKSLSAVIEDSELLNLYQESKRDKQWLKQTKPVLESLKLIDSQLLPERKPKPVSMPRALYKLVVRKDLFSNPEIRKRIKSRLNKLENIDQAISETDNLPPVAFLAKFGLVEEVLLLIDKGAKLKEMPDPNMEDKWEGTLFDVALIRNASDETINLLKKYGANKTKDWIEDECG